MKPITLLVTLTPVEDAEEHGFSYWEQEMIKAVETAITLAYDAEEFPLLSRWAAAPVPLYSPTYPFWNPASHWDDHDCYSVSAWQNEVENGDTRQSYVAWVNSQIEQEDLEDPEDE